MIRSVYMVLLFALSFTPEPTIDAIEASQRSLWTVAKEQNNLWWASRALLNTAQAFIYLGEWEASLACCRRLLAHAATLGDARLKVVGLYRIGAAHIHQGDIERGVRCCDEALSLNPLPYDVAMTKVFRGYGQIRGGRLDPGIADLTEAIAWFEQSRLHHNRVAPALRLAEGYLLQGDLGTAQVLIDDVLTTSRAKGYRYVEGLAHRLLAECLAQDSPTAAAEHVDAAQRTFICTDARNDLAKVLVTRAGLCQRSGDIAEARKLLEEAGAIFVSLGTLDEPTRVRSALASLEEPSRSQLELDQS